MQRRKKNVLNGNAFAMTICIASINRVYAADVIVVFDPVAMDFICILGLLTEQLAMFVRPSIYERWGIVVIIQKNQNRVRARSKVCIVRWNVHGSFLPIDFIKFA